MKTLGNVESRNFVNAKCEQNVRKKKVSQYFVEGALVMGSNESGEAEPETWLSGYCSRKLGELERASAEEVLLPPLAIAMIMGAGTSTLIFTARVRSTRGR